MTAAPSRAEANLNAEKPSSLSSIWSEITGYY